MEPTVSPLPSVVGRVCGVWLADERVPGPRRRRRRRGCRWLPYLHPSPPRHCRYLLCDSRQPPLAPAPPMGTYVPAPSFRCTALPTALRALADPISVQGVLLWDERGRAPWVLLLTSLVGPGRAVGRWM